MIALAAVLASLQAPLDSGVFVVRQDTVEIARESFRLLPSPAGGFTLTATTRYDRGRPVVVLAPLVAFTADSQLATLQYDVADPREPVRILGQLGRGRVTLRYLAHAIERAREFPAGAVTLVLDGSVFALYAAAAWRASPVPATLTVIYPRGARRATLTIRDLGLEATTVNRNPAALRHVVLSGGADGAVHLWLTRDGRLLKVEIPARRVVAERAPGD